MMPLPFGLGRHDEPCQLYTLENDHYQASFTDYGATLVKLYYKDQKTDIVLGFDSTTGYIQQVPYMGSTVGRLCNRVGLGQFSLNGQQYQLPINNHGNTLHGGTDGFAFRRWKVRAYQDNLIIFTIDSADGDQGFPGNVKVTVTYSLMPNGLEFSYVATSDQDTLLGLTNHSYFNLNGPTADTVLDQSVWSPATYIACVDENGLAQNQRLAVSQTPFDFSEPKTLGRDIEMDHPQLLAGHGYDHHFMVEGQGLRPMAYLQANHLRLTVLSDLPGFQMYTANFLKGNNQGKNGATMPRRSGVCFETQFCPNAINTGLDIAPILKAGTTCHHLTRYQIETV